MKKTLFAFAFAFSFLFLGLIAGRVEAASRSMPAISKTQNTNLKTGDSFNTGEFNKKYAGLKAFCENNLGPDCDDAIQIADEIAQEAWSECVRNINVCQAQQDYALGMLEWAMDVCRAEEPPILAEKRKTYFRQSLRDETGGKDVVAK